MGNVSNETSVDDDVNDDVEVSISDVWTVLCINSVLVFILLWMHYKASKQLQSIYCGRNNHISDETKKIEPFDANKPLDWVRQIRTVSWSTVKNSAGLDAYMFLRFLRMCFAISVFSSFYGLVILWPIYYTGDGNTEEWYVLSMQNVTDGNWRLWIGATHMWVTSLFVLWKIQKELTHYFNLRLDFMSNPNSVVDPISNYSLMIECIPEELQSERALYQYFNRLFPDKVHSTSVAMKIPDLKALTDKRRKVLYRLEKAHAYFEATGNRPEHRAGRHTLKCCGIDIVRFKKQNSGTENDLLSDGDVVDSIDYYENQLSSLNTQVKELQEQKRRISEGGNLMLQNQDLHFQKIYRQGESAPLSGRTYESDMNYDEDETSTSTSYHENAKNTLQQSLIVPNTDEDENIVNDRPGQEYDGPLTLNSIAGILGSEFLRDGTKWFKKTVNTVITTENSSTGFVTFTDLATTTAAANTPLGRKGVLIVQNAPEPRDIVWRNIAVDYENSIAKQNSAAIIVAVGAVLWAIPIATIQALATADSLSKVNGLEWLDPGSSFLGNLINGYLPVITILGLILLLPIAFEKLAKGYELRKSKSDIELSVMRRYFIYLLANIYVTVTSASIWDALSEIIDDPSDTFNILGESLPKVVGYFVSFILTKILLGLPSTLMRWGPLSRYLVLRIFFDEKFMSQRELDGVYAKQNFYYGREYPNILLVMSICFTYASIAPVVLPVGAIYFFFAFHVYKLQFVHVISSRYQAGGSLFPAACSLAIVGLTGGQLTLIGFLSLREGFGPAASLFPLVFFTVRCIGKFKDAYERGGRSLTYERARAIDEKETPELSFDSNAYKQNVLTEGIAKPLPYRRDHQSLTEAIAIANEEENLHW